jgi:hypothetical protein
MPTAITPKDGQVVAANLIFKQSDANRGSSLELGLFTNTTGLSETSVLADFTEPTGGSYARITLADASWSIDADGLAEYAKQVFNAVGSAYSAAIYGFFIATTGTTPKLFHFQIEDDGVSVTENESYSVTPIIDLTSV